MSTDGKIEIEREMEFIYHEDIVWVKKDDTFRLIHELVDKSTERMTGLRKDNEKLEKEMEQLNIYIDELEKDLKFWKGLGE